MQYEWITLLGILFIFIVNTLGAASVFFFKKGISERVKSIFFGFAGGVMLAASIWSLLLPAIEQAKAQANGFLSVLLSFCTGGALILALDALTVFSDQQQKIAPSKKLFFAVTLHNIPEGLAVGFAFGAARAIGLQTAYLAALGLAIGIGIQNLPEGAAVALSIRKEGNSANKSFAYGFFSGAIEPVFAILGYFLAALLQVFQPCLLSISAGAMVYVTAEELLPDIGRGEHIKAGAWSFMFGFLLMMTLDVALGG